MRIALISDIHANRHALIEVLEDIDRVGVDDVVCLGDIVGYGPDPGPCLDMVLERTDVILRGNHEDAVLDPRLCSQFNRRATISIEFTRDVLSDGQRQRIALLPGRVSLGDVSFAHACFCQNMYEYLVCPATAAKSFRWLPTRFGAVGHTHRAGLFICPGAPAGTRPDPRHVTHAPVEGSGRRVIGDDARVIVNPGSVGQPRDGNPDASWGLLDLRTGGFEVRRVEYDVEAVARRIMDCGLPLSHSERLRIGA